MTVVLGKPTSIVVPASCRELLIQPTDFPTPSGVSIVPRLRGDDDKKETGMTDVMGEDGVYRGKPTSIVVPASCRELLILSADFPKPSNVSIVPRLRGDDGKEEAGITAVMGWGDGCIKHG
jgi:hypothetical protein